MEQALTLRQAVIDHIKTVYDVAPDYPWFKYPDTGIFRHTHHRKWFAALLPIAKSALALSGQGHTEVLNLKCEPGLADLLRQQPGILPGYHMNKQHWISVLLDGTVPLSQIEPLIRASYLLTQ